MSCRSLMSAAMAAVVGAMLSCQSQVQGAPVVGLSSPIFLDIATSASDSPKLLEWGGGGVNAQCGTPVKLGTINGQIKPNQLWTYNGADSTITSTVDGTVWCLDAAHLNNPPERANRPVVCGCERGNVNQKWTWSDDSTIVHLHSGFCLISTGVGNQLGLSTCFPTPEKLFSQQVRCASGLAKNLDGTGCLRPRQLIVSSSGQRLNDNNAQKSSLATLTNNIITTDNDLWVLDTSLYPGVCGGEPCGLMYTLASRARNLCLDADNPGNPTQPWFQTCDPPKLSQRWSWSRAAVGFNPDPRVIAIIPRSLQDTWLNGNNAPNVNMIYPFLLPAAQTPFWILPF